MNDMHAQTYSHSRLDTEMLASLLRKLVLANYKIG